MRNSQSGYKKDEKVCFMKLGGLGPAQSEEDWLRGR